MEGILTWNERDGTQYMTLSYDLDLGFFNMKFWKSLSQEKDARLTWDRRDWVDRMLDPLCELLAMTLTLIFKVKIW